VLLAFADLVNLKRDPKYPLHMDSSRMNEWLRFLGKHARRPNRLIRSMEDEFDLEAKAAEMIEDRRETTEQGGAALSDAERLRLADLVDEHGSVYWLWSLHSHANLGALWGTHCFPDSAGETRFHMAPLGDLESLITATDGLIGMTLAAIRVAFERLDLDATGLMSLRSDLTEVRADLGLLDEPDAWAAGERGGTPTADRPEQDAAERRMKQ
jgi:hypothetical protein